MNEKYLFEIKQKLNIKSISFRESVSLAPLSSFKIGGISPLVIEPENTEQLFECIEIISHYDTVYKILGGGSNLLISDFPNDFIIIKLSGKFKEFQEVEEGKFYIGSAMNTTPTFKKISMLGYSGLEFLSTIPGWVGGAVIQNAGCYDGEIFNQINFVEFIREGKFYKKKPSEIEYGYRFTEFLRDKNSIITFVEMKAEKGNLHDIEFSLTEKREKRNSSQPENKKSAGSVFKNPQGVDEEGNPMKSWKLIDAVGLRGFRKNGAEISAEHCNFIVNTGDAKAKDVDYLIQIIQEKVYEKFNRHLEREIEYFGTI